MQKNCLLQDKAEKLTLMVDFKEEIKKTGTFSDLLRVPVLFLNNQLKLVDFGKSHFL